MPSSYTDQFYLIDPSAPPPNNTLLTVQNFSLTDQNDDGFIGTGVGDTIDGQLVTTVWVGDTITLRIPGGGGRVTITGVTFYLADGRSLFTPTDGTILQDARFRGASAVGSSTQVPVGSLAPPCFTRGTLISTPDGDRKVEDLQVGDLVLTMDHGPQPILLISKGTYAATGHCAPVRIARGALGNNVELEVSQQHRMLICGWQAELYFGAEQVLVAAKMLCNGDTIAICPGGEVEYYHLLFAEHEIIWGAGIPSESYFPGCAAHQTDEQTQREIKQMLPELGNRIAREWETARMVIRGFEAVLLN